MSDDELERLHCWALSQLRRQDGAFIDSDAELLAELQKVSKDALTIKSVFATQSIRRVRQTSADSKSRATAMSKK